MFQGSPAAAVSVFANAGFPCPPLTNPADHVMDIITPRASGIDPANEDASGRSLSLRLQEPPVIE